MFTIAKKLPFLRLVVLVRLALLAQRHVAALSPRDRKRLLELARKPHKLSKRERRELRSLAAKLEPGAFAKGAARAVAPMGRKKR